MEIEGDIKLLAISLRILQLELELSNLKRIKKELKRGNESSESQEFLTEFVYYKSKITQRSRSNSISLLVMRADEMKLKIEIDNKKNHMKPHLHVGLGGEFRNASIAIKDGEILAGELPSWVKKTITKWIKKNRRVLNKVWHEVQKGEGAKSKSKLKKIKL